MLFEEYYLYRAGDQGDHECRIPAQLTTDTGTVLAFNEDYSHVIYSDDHGANWHIGGQDRLWPHRAPPRCRRKSSQCRRRRRLPTVT